MKRAISEANSSAEPEWRRNRVSEARMGLRKRERRGEVGRREGVVWVWEEVKGERGLLRSVFDEDALDEVGEETPEVME